MTASNMTEASSNHAEMMVLGAMLNSDENTKIALKLVHEDDFFEKKHRIIFKAIRDILLEKDAVEIGLVQNKLKVTGDHETAGSAPYLIDLAQYAGTSSHIEAYCEDLQKLTRKRQLIAVNNDLSADLKKDADETKIIEKLKAKIKDIEAHNRHAESNFRKFIQNNSESALINDLKNISPGVSTGFTIGDIDLKLPGGALSVIALPTGHGKTTFLINTTLGVLKQHHDISAYFFSYEENAASILTYFINSWIGKELSKNNRESIQSYFRSGSLEFIRNEMRDEFNRLKNAFFEHIIDKGLLRVFYTDMSVEELIAAIRFLKNNTSVGLICIDYIQCLRLMKQFQGTRQEQLKEISHMLKDVAVETGLPILLGAQFNRQVLCEADLSPTNIREAADIEQIAALLIGGWNRNYNGFSRQGNISKSGNQIPSESAIYLEIMKGRGIGNGHNSVLDFDGNIGKLTNKPSNHVSNFEKNNEELCFMKKLKL